jgi:hypothetical protein
MRKVRRHVVEHMRATRLVSNSMPPSLTVRLNCAEILPPYWDIRPGLTM